MNKGDRTKRERNGVVREGEEEEKKREEGRKPEGSPEQPCLPLTTRNTFTLVSSQWNLAASNFYTDTQCITPYRERVRRTMCYTTYRERERHNVLQHKERETQCTYIHHTERVRETGEMYGVKGCSRPCPYHFEVAHRTED